MTRTLRDIVKVETQALPVEAFSFLRKLFVGDRKAINAFELATQVLSDFADDKLAKARGANESLRAAILEHYPRFLATLPTEDDGFYGLRDGILEIDTRFADYIENTFGDHGKELAGEIRKDEQTIKNASDSIPLREWSRKWREFSRSEKGKAISDAESRHIERVRLDTVAKFGDLEMPVDPRSLLRWLKDSQVKPFEDLQKEILPLVNDREAFTGPIEGLSQSLFSVWLGDKIYKQIASVTSLRNCQFTSVLWLHVVRPEIERERTRENARAPSYVMTTIRDGRRDGGLAIGPWGKDGTPHVQVVPPKGFALYLPWDADVEGENGETVSIRQTLTGQNILVYLAACTSWLDEGRDPGGRFIFDENFFLGEYLGSRRIARSDKKGSRFTSKNRASLRASFETLQRIHVKSVGDVVASEAEPLIQKYHQKSTGKHLYYRHSPLLVDALNQDYTQFPRAVLRQDAKDAALSIGMASFVREKATVLMKHNGTHEAPLSYWLEKAGEDPADGKRRLGNAYFQKASDKLKRVIQEGEVGSFSGVGDGAASLLTFTADTTLLGAYEPLKKAQAEAIKIARTGNAIAAAKARSKKK